MKTTTKAEQNTALRNEAARCLRNYLATGIKGFRQQGLDRCRAAGIYTAACEGDDQGILHLVHMIECGWCY